MRYPQISALSRLLLILATPVATGEAMAQTTVKAKGVNGATFQYLVFHPAQYDAGQTYPIVMLPRLGADSSRTGKPATRALTDLGFLVVVFQRSRNAMLSHVIGHLRRKYRIATQRIFLPLPTGVGLNEPRSWSTERPTDFHVLENPGGEPLVRLITRALGKLLPNSRVKRAVGAVLDDFHDCASKADGPRYFGHFAPKGVFLGTDPSERWPQAEFRAWGGKYFEGDSAWIYVPQRRHVDVVGDLAWFDESLHSDSYGACRGTGALRKIDGVWKIVQYHLSVPIPNALLGDLVTMVRNATDSKARGVTTVFLVRHAEKREDGEDPLLTEVGQARARRLAMHLSEVEIDVCYTTQFKRTQRTAEPTSKTKGIEITVLDARIDVGARIMAKNRGQSVLVAGHSNTVPAILRKLGVRQRIEMGESDYSDLFVVTIELDGRTRLLRLKY